MEHESYKDINGHEGYYKISEGGNVRTVDHIVIRSNGRPHHVRERILRPRTCAGGYLNVALLKDGHRSQHRIHRLVANAFIPNPDNKPEVNHEDFDVSNNCVSNLSWCTSSDNRMHTVRHGRHYRTNGSNSGRSKLTEEIVIAIRDQYEPYKITAKMLSQKHGVSISTIERIVSNKSWNHI